MISRYLELIRLSLRQIAELNRKTTDFACPILSQICQLWYIPEPREFSTSRSAEVIIYGYSFTLQVTTATVLHGIVQFLSPLSGQSLRRGWRHSLQQGPGSVTESKSIGTWSKCYVYCSRSWYCHVTPLLSQSLLRNRGTLNARVGCTMRTISMLGRPTKAVSKRRQWLNEGSVK